MGFIDIEACAAIVIRMRDVADDVQAAQSRLRSQADHVDLDASSLRDLGADVAEVRRMAGELRTRVDLAIAIESARSGAFPGASTAPVEIPNSSGENLLEDLAQALAAAATTTDVEDEKARAWLAEALDRHSGDEQFAALFLADLGPDEMLDLMGRTAAANYGAEGPGQRTILASLRDMLQLADATWTPDARADFAEGLVQAATWQDPDVADRKDVRTYGAALAYLLAQRRYSTEFSVAAAIGLEEYERSILNGIHGPEAVWDHRLHAGNPFLQYHAGVSELGDIPPRTWDPSAALMSSLAKNPEAALAVFSRGADGRDVTPTLQHWLVDRTWTEDQFNELSAALAAATVDPGLMADPENDFARAIVTAATVNLIGARDDIDRDLLTNDAGPTGAADNFSRILAANVLAMDYATRTTYAVSLPAASVDPDGAVWFGPGKLGLVPVLDSISPSGDGSTLSPLARFAVLASATEESTMRLRTAVDRWAELKYAVSLNGLQESLSAAGTVVTTDNGEAQLRDHPKADFLAALQSQGALEGMLAHAVGRADIDDARRDDARTALWTGVITDTLGLIPYTKTILGDFPEGLTRRAIELGFSKTESTAVGLIDANTASGAKTAAEGAAKMGLARAEYQVVMALATSGLASDEFTSSLLQPDGTPVPYDTYAALLPSGTNNLLDPGAFGTLFGENGISGPYDKQFFQRFPK